MSTVVSTLVTDMRFGFAANLRTLAAQVQVSEYMLSNPTPPTIWAFPGGPAGDVDYDQANARGLDEWPWTVQLLVGLTGDIAAQMMLDQFLAPFGATSVKEAIESDRTLGGAVDDLIVDTCTGYRQFAFEGRPSALGAEWYVTVLASGRS